MNVLPSWGGLSRALHWDLLRCLPRVGARVGGRGQLPAPSQGYGSALPQHPLLLSDAALPLLLHLGWSREPQRLGEWFGSIGQTINLSIGDKTFGKSGGVSQSQFPGSFWMEFRWYVFLFLKLEMVQEAAQKIRRYYSNTYKYGPGAKTICKYRAYFSSFGWLSCSQEHDWYCLIPRPGSRWLWRLGVQPRHQILLHIWAAGPRALRIPSAAISHCQGLQWSSACCEDHC